MAKIFIRSNNTYVFINCMRKRNLILPFFIGSLFVPSLESIQSATVSNLYKKENITFQAIDEIPLASTSGATGGGGGGGGGGGPKSKQQKANLEKNKKKAQEAAKKRIKAKESKDAEPKEKIAISKLDDVGTSFRGGQVKEQIKKLTAKIAIASVSNISAKVVKLQDEAKNINPANIDEWIKKTDEIALKIAALEDLQKEIDDFLNLNIDSMVYCIKFMDNPNLEKESNARFFASVVKVLQKKAIYMDNYSSLWAKAKAAGILNNEFKKALKDIQRLTSEQFDYLSELF